MNMGFWKKNIFEKIKTPAVIAARAPPRAPVQWCKKEVPFFSKSFEEV